jgi:hypothetical protein
MSQISLTNDERVRAVMTLGYTEREATFLCLVALLGGYFLRRQFCQYLGIEVGGTAAALIEKLLQNKHAAALIGSHNVKVYHLSSRRLYAALGQEDNRNRRCRETLAIQRRLMILDFVLGHLAHVYFTTEQDKVDFFTGTRRLPLSVLPAKQYRSPSTGQVTTRYFVDKSPIYYPSSNTSVMPPVHFCYVDEALTRSGFETFLSQYRSLFEALGQFRLVYVTASAVPGASAGKVFERFIARIGTSEERQSPAALTSRLNAYFAMRRQYEGGQLDGFDRSRLIQLRNDRQRFSGVEYEAVYERWKQVGAAAFHALPSQNLSPIPSLDASFSVHVLPHQYAIFGSLEEPTDAA